MTEYKLINERWNAFVKQDTLEEQFNRELNKLLKELQVLNEQQDQPGVMGKIAQKVGQFVKSALSKIESAIKSSVKTATSLVNKLIQAAGTFLRDPKNKAKIISAIRTVGVMALIAAALYSPEAQAAIVDPDTGATVGGSDVLSNAIRGSLSMIADSLDQIVRTDIDPKAMGLKDEVLKLISKINSPEKVEMSELQKYIYRTAKVALQVVRDVDKEQGSNQLTSELVNFGKKFSDFIITKTQDVTTTFKGQLPGTGKGGVSFGKEVGDMAAKTLIKR
jgi:hypothetical protein